MQEPVAKPSMTSNNPQITTDNHVAVDSKWILLLRQDTGLTAGDALELVEDRQFWRTIKWQKAMADS